MQIASPLLHIAHTCAPHGSSHPADGFFVR
jgi:hypothetical protein